MSDEYLQKLNLPPTLADRILCRVPPTSGEIVGTVDVNNKPYVLYLPTVVLRKRHNPGFALACRIANHFQLPLVVLCTVLDDQHLTRQPYRPVCMTARRLAFTLEALQSCTREWEDHGAGVAIRVHGPGARIPHHLTMSHQARAVVTDEPFVEPFRTYMRKIVSSCQSAKVPCFTVDGSTTVPPKSKLRISNVQKDVPGDMCFLGVPAKAWIWEKLTNPTRKSQVYGALKDKHLDAPELNIKLTKNFFLSRDDGDDRLSRLQVTLPAKWKIPETSCPGTRPWTVEELLTITDLKKWVMTCWPGADTTVAPCRQTQGTQAAARQRWKSFLNHGLAQYAKRRNQIDLPHAVSRMSCYLNLGIISIMDVVADVWEAQKRSGSEGCRKFLDEVIKWREIGYVHTFSTPSYHTFEAIPRWAHEYLLKQYKSEAAGYTYKTLEDGATGDDTWNAMQSYLVETGELHNNARMTWGKTVVHWQATRVAPDDVLWQLVTLNDRHALDGLSPPSYAGILWCFGWCDKPGPGSSVSTKWARQYRKGPDNFEQAKISLYSDCKLSTTLMRSDRPAVSLPISKRARQDETPDKNLITAYFSSARKTKSSF